MTLSKKFQTARFHKSTGPQSLFDRIFFKMSAVNHLDLHGKHYNRKLVERNVPAAVLSKIENFSATEWELIMCEVLTDKGKFINSTWETVFNGRPYRITIGFNNLVMTVVAKNVAGNGNVVTGGELYNFVDKVNSELNLSETRIEVEK